MPGDQWNKWCKENVSDNRTSETQSILEYILVYAPIRYDFICYNSIYEVGESVIILEPKMYDDR